MGDLIMEDSKIEKAKQRVFLAIKNHVRAKAYLKKAEIAVFSAKDELREAEQELWNLAEEEAQ
jgi:hypothetical protein